MHRKYVFPASAEQDYFASYKYLTYLNVHVQLIFFFIALVLDLARICSGSKLFKLNRWKDYFFASVAFPYTMLVFSTFWTIYLYDRELIFPASFDLTIPKYVNHLLHTTIVVTGLELYLKKVSYPTRKSGIASCVSAGLAYFLWISYIKSVVGYWPYPFMNLLTAPAFGLFLLVVLALLCIFYSLGERLHVEASLPSYIFTKKMR